MSYKHSVLLLALSFNAFTILMATNSSVVYLDPVILDSPNVCSSQLVDISSARSNISEALRTVVTPYLNTKYGNGENYVRECGGEGWTRMVYLNMTDTNTQCPSNWRLNTASVRGCGLRSPAYVSCDSTYFSNPGLSYNRVCGRIIAYQKGHPDGFDAYFHNVATTIETAYTAGVLLTHGPVGSRKHIWTFANALFKQSYLYQASHRDRVCPCTTSALSWPYNIPPFVGNNYFCDSGNPGPSWSSSTLYADDPLWDGAGCPSTSSCCQFNNPPWFNTTLPETTTDGMEVRLCLTNSSEDVIVSLIELYVA